MAGQRFQDKRIPFYPDLASDIEVEISTIIRDAISVIYVMLDKSELKVDTRGFDKRFADHMRNSRKRPGH